MSADHVREILHVFAANDAQPVWFVLVRAKWQSGYPLHQPCLEILREELQYTINWYAD